MAKRANGEGSIYPYRNGYAAHVWVTTPNGEHKRKSVYGKTREACHAEWVKLHQAAARGPVATSTPTVAAYLADYWLKEIVREPDYAPMTIATYGTFVRYYIVPHLGRKKLDKLSVRDVRSWINTLRKTCQCCAQGKDAARKPDKYRCCAKGECCRSIASERTIQDARGVLRSALSNAMREELLSRNVAQLVKLKKPRPRKVKPWTVEEARRFLESARADNDPLYAAYVLILVMGLRKGEVLGTTWPMLDLDAGELDTGLQIQRVGRRLLHRQTKTEASDTTLPMPGICVAALRLRAAQQEADREAAGVKWAKNDRGLVFTGPRGQPIDPRGFNRKFDRRCERAGVRRIEVHTTRKTCATLLAALDVHPRVAMAILRHSEVEVTMEVYTEATSEATQAALKKLGDYFSGEPEATPTKEKDPPES